MTAADIAPPFRLKAVPILVTIVMGLGLPYVAAIAAVLSAKALHVPLTQGGNLHWLFWQHAFQLGVALVVIAILKFWLLPADYGLHWPRGKTYIWPAVLWGALFGVVMAIPDNWSHLLAHTRPDPGYPLTPANIWAWQFFETIYVGPTEEIPFRALLVTYLATTMPGKLTLGRFNMNWAGIIVALLFALLHATSFFTEKWYLAAVQQVYAFMLGVLYAYWLEKSKSVVAPIIGHNMSDGLENLIVVVWSLL